MQGLQGNFNRLSLDEAVLMAKRILKVADTSEYDNDIEMFCTDRFIKQKNIQDFQIINTSVDVINGQAELPSGVYRFLAMRFCDQHGNAYGRYYVDQFWLKACNCTVDGHHDNYVGTFQIVGNSIIFKNFEECPKSVKIAYWGYYTDEDNFPLITQDDITPIAYYAAYQVGLMNIERYSQYQIESWKRLAASKTRHVASHAQLRRWQDNRFTIGIQQRQINISLI